MELSFEFFPPKSADGIEKLRATRARLMPLKPRFVSVTFGAGGSTQQGTLDTVIEIARSGVEAAPHLSCIGASAASIAAILGQFRENGIRRIVALRGDLPSGMVEIGEFPYASDLVRFIRRETGDWFHIEVAAYPEYHPQARSPRDDLDNLVRKFEAGADSAITQYFFNADAYFRLRDDASRRGIAAPIVPGIMPITNYAQLSRFSAMCGAEVPRWIGRRLESFGDDRESIRAFGLDVVSAMCERLLAEGVPGLHFYTLNGAAATEAVCRRLGLGAA
ncbi:methylenetetrahydrofolate reductase [NAD(P)H] [Chitinasiproducens palmae]|uniref:Methylenetetrahydrofolate reductase n=1 Tax=Chitinasiproducens palmae TaxID=1770053 RepID=A0A1H2PT90_9BURK|nr:methylenetetrahydrofolate reductase [NAD(P)H] [Chitinasiproducens palmae]SDV50318.1 5,10-methylenetetrahydrofolate reductase (NAD(P)) [Chitinasiproducens palmae]